MLSDAYKDVYHVFLPPFGIGSIEFRSPASALLRKVAIYQIPLAN
jgi:hypothetical protein